ncbi:conserved hypothetical protein [Burkholderia sp. 8Y]|uniref:hypothetical protein n=1 Tax=Burkholderia sp. 8Y TaxID=2653133 RepID=UPI0012F2D808|nr:hypothetical protein [Burkholderia sp. 8Y]VXB24302.1 conserved hypothetical protein [Burkholderia sp. 8Y]
MTKEWKVWTPEEDALLREVWAQPGTLKASIGKFPGRTINAIRFRGSVDLALPRRGSLRATTYSWCEEVIDDALRNGFAGTADQIAEVTSASPNRVRAILREGEEKKYHVSDWAKRSNGCDWSPIWVWGGGERAPKPERQTSAVLSKRFRTRKKLKEGQYNPFDVLARQVVNGEKQALAIRGRYQKRIYVQEAA